MASNKILGITIEGLGASTSKAKGVALCVAAGARMPSAGDREWWPAIGAWPGALADSIDIYAGTWQTGALSFELMASDRVVALLFASARDSVGELGSSISASATSLDVGVADLAGQVVWLGDEAILLGEEDPAGIYAATRGFWDSEAISHDAGDLIFARPPYLDGRIVKIIEHDLSDGSEVMRAQLVLSDLELNEASISITCEDLLTRWLTAEINDSAINLAAAPNVSCDVLLSGQGNARGLVAATSAIRPSSSSGQTVTMQVNDSLASALVTGQGIRIGGGRLLLGSPAIEGERGEAPSKIFEVFCIDRISEINPLSALELPYHPAAIALALLVSTGQGINGDYDLLSSAWGLGLGLVDISAIESLISETEGLMIDRLLLGWDGQPVKLLATIAKVLLQPFGLIFARTVEGLLSISSIAYLDVATWQALQDEGLEAFIDGPLVLSKRLGDTPTQVSAQLGALPWDAGQHITIRPSGRSSRRARIAPARASELDLQVIDPSLYQDNPILYSALQVRLDAAPRVRLRVADYRETGGQPYTLGAWTRISSLSVQSAWIVGPDGARTLDISDPGYAGLIVARSFDLQTRSYELDLLLLMYSSGAYVRERGPAGLIVSASGADLDLAPNTFGGNLDAARFTVGDEVWLYERSGEPLAMSGTPTISAISGNTITLSGLVDSAYPGLVVRLAPSTVYANNARYPVTQRPYSYWADAQAKIIEQDSSTSAPDIYGTRQAPAPAGALLGVTNFNALDDDAFNSATSATSGQCLPLDAFCGHQLRANLSRVVTDGHQVPLMLLSGHSDDYTSATRIRPWASLYPSSIFFVPWLYQPGLRAIKASMIARIAQQGAESGAVGVELIPYSRQIGQQSEAASCANSEASTPTFQPYEIDLELSGQVAAQEVGALGLWLTSELDEAAIDTDSVNADVFSFFLDATDAGFYADSGATRPNDDALDTQATIVAPQAGSGGAAGASYDHMFGFNDNTTLMATYPDPQPGGLASRHHLSYAQIRSIEVAQTFDDERAQSSLDLRGGAVILGEVEGTHALRANLARGRARPLWLGPEGWPAVAESGWPSGYIERWLTTNPTATDLALIEPIVLPSTDDPTLLVMAYVIPTIASSIGAGLDLEAARQAAAKIPWTVKLTADQSDGGAADVISATNSAVVTLEHYQVAGFSPFPALKTIATKTLTGITFSYKEGQLFNADLPLVQLVSVAVPITRDAASESLVKCSLTIEPGPGSSPLDWGQVPRRGRYLDNAFFTVIGASIWEIPQ